MSEDLTDAIALIQEGNKPAARPLLIQLIRSNPQNMSAWLWLVETMTDAGQRVKVLEECVRFNPQSETAHKALAALRGHTAPEVEPAASPQTEPTVAPAPNRAAAFPQTSVVQIPPRPTKSSKAAFYLSYLFTFVVLLAILVLVVALMPPPAVGMPALTLEQPRFDPNQSTLSGEQAQPFTRSDWGYTWTLTPRAGYQITARVLGKMRYFFDIRSRIAPYDLALGWGEIGDTTVDQWISWSQRGRWYYYRWSADSPLGGETIRDHSANTHILPATRNIESAIGKLKVNDTVYLEGRLVDLHTVWLGNNWYGQTSLIRNDSGNGACETLYVERIVFGGQEYK